MSILDPKFRYEPAASHNDAGAFRRRQQERRRRVEESAGVKRAADEQAAREAHSKVRELRKVKA